MAKTYPIQEQFGAGVLTKRFFGRISTPGYKAGAAELDNFIILRQGPIDKRFGTNSMYQLPEAVTFARLLSFQVDNENSYPVILANNGKIYIYDNGAIVEFTHTMTEADIKECQFAMQPGAPVMYIVAKKHAPTKITLAASVFSYATVSFTGTPAQWVAGNYPGAIIFYQGRMWLAGTPNQGSTFWGSVSGAYETFTTGSTAESAIVYSIARRGAIQWMSGASDLVFGTENGESIAIAQGQLLKVGDIDVKQQSAMGSRKAMPVQVGNKINFISPDGRKIYQMGYRWTDNGWIAQDLTFTSEDITESGKTVREVHWAQNPEQLMYMICDNGDFFGATRDVENDIIGWYNLSTAGYVCSGGVLEIAGSSTFWTIVRREFNGVTRTYLERVSTVHYLDNAEVITDNVNPISNVTIARFANETMTCTVDGAIHPPLVFNGAGEATLAFPGNVVIVGLPYTAYLLTMPYATSSEGASTASTRKRYNKIVCRFQDSRLPKINGQRPPERSPSTPMDTVEPASDLSDVAVWNNKWDEYAQISVEQDLPISCRLLAVFGQLNLETT